jgi:hypothetical protein
VEPHRSKIGLPSRQGGEVIFWFVLPVTLLDNGVRRRLQQGGAYTTEEVHMGATPSTDSDAADMAAYFNRR